MTDRDLLAAIHTLQVRAAEQVGEIQGRVHNIEADVAVVRESSVQQGLAIAALPCAQNRARMAKLSEEVHRLGGSLTDVREDTDVLHLEDMRRRTVWWTIAKAAGAVLALAGLVVGAWGSIRGCAGVQDLRAADAAAGQQVQLVVQDHARDDALTWIMERQRELLQRLPRLDWLVAQTGGDVPRPKWR
jgi:hypothetical protein